MPDVTKPMRKKFIPVKKIEHDSSGDGKPFWKTPENTVVIIKRIRKGQKGVGKDGK